MKIKFTLGQYFLILYLKIYVRLICQQ